MKDVFRPPGRRRRERRQPSTAPLEGSTPICSHQRHSGWGAFFGKDDGSSLHDVTAGRAANDSIGGSDIWRVVGGLGVCVRHFRSWQLVNWKTVQLMAQGSQPLAQTGAEEAIVAHLNKGFRQNVL